ncbi:hypothetical protein [uncultured Paenibacillus sp.]|uniref:hypothetical protein n=1 Tax=uncultured Paenibacillus sp. TaxID=227322 RepID=UPI0028D504A4|nr:hypothetical protein [uncultured Paenibacillus sp.]
MMALTAEHASILTPKDVGNIRNYVRHKYAGLPQERHAEIVADAVHRIIYRQLPEYGEALKRQLTSDLIRTTVVGESRPVTAVDVLEAGLRLGWRQPQLNEPLLRWIESRLGAAVERKALEAVLTAAQQAAEPGRDSASIAWLRLREMTAVSAGAGMAGGEAAPLAPVVPLFSKARPKTPAVVYVLLSIALVCGMAVYGWQNNRANTASDAQRRLAPAIPVPRVPIADKPGWAIGEMGSEVPEELRYTYVDETKVKAFLAARKSLLRREPYYGAIVAAARAYDIHPLLLFAITGQEQSFVPEDGESAKEIANNPFNVYHSWQKYNTNIEDSAAIAARTIITLSRDRPEGKEPIAWINRKYAEDPNWNKGVTRMFESLKQAEAKPSAVND